MSEHELDTLHALIERYEAATTEAEHTDDWDLVVELEEELRTKHGWVG